jgi:cation transport ATPase
MTQPTPLRRPPRPGGGRFAGGLLGVSLTLLVGGGLAQLAGASTAADAIWVVATPVGVGPAARWLWLAVRERRLGVDLIAVLALVGTLAVEEYLAGAVITVMLATGRTLEARAAARARSELRALRERAPRLVHRVDGQTLAAPPLEDVVPGDLLLVQPGEIVPVDGHVERDVAVLGGQESTATMSRAHAEIARLIRRLGRVLDGHDPGPE